MYPIAIAIRWDIWIAVGLLLGYYWTAVALLLDMASSSLGREPAPPFQLVFLLQCECHTALGPVNLAGG